MTIGTSKRMTSLLQEGIFSSLKKLKNKLVAEGMEIIDLSVGSPDLPPLPRVVDAIQQAVKDDSNYRYAISDLPELRKTVSRWYDRRFGVFLDPDSEICSLMGSQDGLAHVCLSLIDEGDTVLVHDPGYPIFHAGPQLAGANVVALPQRVNDGYLIDFHAIPEHVAREAKLMIVSYPNNPTTAVAPPGFFEDLVYFAKRHEVMVVHDNAYCELVYDNKAGGSFLSIPGAMDVGIEFNSLSKTYNMAGARAGFALGNREMIKRLSALKSHLDYGMFLPIQMGAMAALNGDQQCVIDTRLTYQRRRDVLCEGLNRKGWVIQKPPATMFVWAALPKGYRDSTAFCLELARRTGVILTPGAAFGSNGEGHVRMALVQREDILKEAVERIASSGMIG